MANLFKDALSGDGGKNSMMGPDYSYYKFIKSPSEIGMSDKGSLKQMGNNIDGLIDYVNLLVTGKSNASTTGGPLGNKFFLKTGGKCMDKSNVSEGEEGVEVDRYIYVNNVPMGNIPFISSGTGQNFSEFKGLIPGTISNLNAFNPMGLMRSFLAGSKPDCQEITMETIDTYNNRSTESHFVTTVDIKSMDPCAFLDKRNVITDAKCKETFSNMKNQLNPNMYECVDYHFKVPNDPVAQAYFASIGALGIYIMYRLMVKMDLAPPL
jgi:hypothetical protein